MPIYYDSETTDLNADIGILVATGFILPDGKLLFFFSDTPDDEREVIRKTYQTFLKFKDEKIYVWNTSFDIPFLITRAIVKKLNISEIYNLKFVDLCRFVRENLKLTSNSLSEVSRFLGLDKDFKLSGKDVQKLYIQHLSGNRRAKKTILEHCKDDLLRLMEIHKRLKPYIQKWESSNYHNNFKK